jgi:uncharacterized membrane protein
MLMREKEQALVHLSNEQYEKAQRSVGKIDILKWVIDLPVHMAREIDNQQPKE